MYIRLVLLLFILNSCDFPERDCLKFKTGTFEFKSISEEGDTLITKFTRTKDLEIGYFNGKIDSNSVIAGNLAKKIIDVREWMLKKDEMDEDYLTSKTKRK